MSKHRLAKFLIIAFLPPVVGAFFVTWFAFSMQYLWLYIDDFIGKGLAAYEVLKLIFLNAVSLIPLAMPLGILLGSIITFGNLGEKSELTAVKAAGISIIRFSKSLIIFVFFLTCASFLFNNYVIPKTQLKAFRDYYDIVNKKPALNIKEGIFFKEIPEQIIYIGKKEKDNETIRNVKIFDNSDDNGNTKLVTATTGKMYMTDDKRFLVFELKDGWRYEYHDDINAQNFEQTRFKFGFWRKSFDLAFLKKNKTSEDYFQNMNQVMTIFEIQKEIDSSNMQLKKTHQGLGELVQNNFLGLNKKIFPLSYFSVKKIIDNKKIPLKDTINKDNKLIINKNILANKKDTILNKKLIALSKKKTKKKKLVLLNTFLKYVPDSLLSPTLSNVELNGRSIKNSIEINRQNIKLQIQTLNDHKIEWHKRLALPFSIFVLFFVGISLGAIIRKGGLGMPFIMAVCFFVIYHVLNTVGEKIAKEELVPVWFGIWMATFIISIMAIFLLIKANNDKPLLNKDAFLKLYYKLKPNKNKF